MEFFCENSSNFLQRPVLDVWQVSEYVSVCDVGYVLYKQNKNTSTAKRASESTTKLLYWPFETSFLKT